MGHSSPCTKPASHTGQTQHRSDQATSLLAARHAASPDLTQATLLLRLVLFSAALTWERDINVVLSCFCVLVPPKQSDPCRAQVSRACNAVPEPGTTHLILQCCQL